MFHVNFSFSCLEMIMNMKQKKIKIGPRIKLNYNIHLHTMMRNSFSSGSICTSHYSHSSEPESFLQRKFKIVVHVLQIPASKREKSLCGHNLSLLVGIAPVVCGHQR